MKWPSPDRLAWTACALASAVLAAQPVQWLVRSWISPAYGSYGYIYVLLILVLVARSVLSGPPAPTGRRAPVLALLGLAALIRLLGQVLAINLLGALALAIDIFALTQVMRLDQRRFALSPFWMAGLFLFALPVNVIVQRVIGFPLQMLSADLSCGALRMVFAEVICDCIRITLSGRDILVDLPCSGASGLVLSLAFVVAQNAVLRPRWWVGTLGLVAMTGAAVLGNSLRISVLAVGHAWDLDVMAAPWHELIGLCTLALTLLPFALFYRPRACAPAALRPLPRPRGRIGLGAGLGLLAASLAIVSVQPDPLDVSAKVTPPNLPRQILGHIGHDIALAPIEAAYFQTYGGQAQKRQFGPMGVNMVSTRAPLRHLHAPEICLRGLGYQVRFLGTRYDGLPSAFYQATGPDGDQWLVAVSYLSPDGQATPGVGEAIWRWMTGATGTWHSLQRITPWPMPSPTRSTLDAAVLAALDLSPI